MCRVMKGARRPGTSLSVIMILALMLHGGCTKRVYVPMEGETRVESRVEYRERIDTVRVTVMLPTERLVNVTRDSVSRLETVLAVSEARVDSTGRLTHTLENKAGGMETDVPVKGRDRDSIVYVDRKVPVPMEKPLGKWERTRIEAVGIMKGIAGAAVLVGIGMLVWMIKRRARR